MMMMMMMLSVLPRHGMRIKLPNLEKVLTATESVACFGFVHCLKEAFFSNLERYLRGIKQAKFKLTRSVLVEFHCAMSAQQV